MTLKTPYFKEFLLKRMRENDLKNLFISTCFNTNVVTKPTNILSCILAVFLFIKKLLATFKTGFIHLEKHYTAVSC